MAVNWTVVQALRETYGAPELIQKRKEVLEEVMSGVTITQVTFEGGGASGTTNGRSPEWMLEHLQAAIGGETPGGSATGRFMDLSKIPFGT